MDLIRIAVGSKRKPKLAAVSAALDSFASLLAPDARFEVMGIEVESGVTHTPTSREELMQGARQRADALIALARDRCDSFKYFVGLEGGLDVLPAGEARSRRVFLESWAYVSDGLCGHFGCSGGIEMPAALAHEALDHGIELSVAIDRFAGAVGIRDAQGAWGVLTRNLIGRQEAFRVAVVAAFTPFYNAPMYAAASAKVAWWSA